MVFFSLLPYVSLMLLIQREITAVSLQYYSYDVSSDSSISVQIWGQRNILFPCINEFGDPDKYYNTLCSVYIFTDSVMGLSSLS